MPLRGKICFVNSIMLLCGHRHNKRLRKTASVFTVYREVRQYIVYLNC